MDNLNNIKLFLMDEIEKTTSIMSSCRLENKYDTAYHFECERKAYLNVLDFLTDEIKRAEKGGE